MSDQQQTEELAEAFLQRMTWPSMHWKTQSLDPEAARALAKVALDYTAKREAEAQQARADKDHDRALDWGGLR